LERVFKETRREAPNSHYVAKKKKKKEKRKPIQLRSGKERVNGRGEEGGNVDCRLVENSGVSTPCIKLWDLIQEKRNAVS